MTMPGKVLASVGFDALCHSMEAYTSRMAQPFTDALALYAMKLTADCLVKAYKHKDDGEAWDKITLASTIGGMVINTAGVTLAHGMEHPVSGLKDIVHGQGLAALTDIPWMAHNCMKVSAAGVASNPVVFTEAEIADLYRAAM